jgi:uncharacterized membrane protein YiaA
MPALTERRAAGIAWAVAFAVFLPSLMNGWSGDDTLMIEANVVVHSAGSALRAWFETYWRYPFSSAGLYRPLTILTYGIDWSLFGGDPWWFHFVNVTLHAVVTALVVLVVAQWLRPGPALVAGLVFAVHPVHVEAVANVVGRAELLVAVGLLGAVITARKYRAAGTGREQLTWFVGTLVMVAFALHAKENGIIALPLLVLDHALGTRNDGKVHAGLYIGVVTVTVAWFYVWNAIAGPYAGMSAHGGFFGLTDGERLATMFPAYLELLRLLAFPLELASDYSPQVVLLRLEWTWIATLGLLATASFAALGIATIKRSPVIAFSIIALLMSYAPVANLLFPSGVVLSERGLYLGIIVPAVVVAVAFSKALDRGRERFAVVALALGVVLLTTVSVQRIPFWKDALNPILEERAAHPENYRNRYLLSEYLSFVGDTSLALSEMLLSAKLNPREPFIPIYASRLAVAQGRPQQAVNLALRAFGKLPTDGQIQEMLAVALLNAGMLDSASAVVTAAMAITPTSARTAETVVYVMEQTGAPVWKWHLAVARRDWLDLNLVSVVAHLDSALVSLPSRVARARECRFLGPMLPMAQWVKVDAVSRIEATLANSGVCPARPSE